MSGVQVVEVYWCINPKSKSQTLDTHLRVWNRARLLRDQHKWPNTINNLTHLGSWVQGLEVQEVLLMD